MFLDARNISFKNIYNNIFYGYIKVMRAGYNQLEYLVSEWLTLNGSKKYSITSKYEENFFCAGEGVGFIFSVLNFKKDQLF